VGSTRTVTWPHINLAYSQPREPATNCRSDRLGQGRHERARSLGQRRGRTAMEVRRDRGSLPSEVRSSWFPPRGTSQALTSRRKKLKPTFDHIINSNIDPTRRSGEAGDVEPDVQSVINVEVPPWAESYELTSTETEGMHRSRMHRLMLI